MKTLIVYGTNSTSTLEACEIVRDEFLRRHHAVTLRPAETAEPDELGRYDLTILASCTWGFTDEKGKYWEGQLQQGWRDLAEKLSGKAFPGQRFAVLALGDSRYYERFCAAADHLERIIVELQGVQVPPTLRLDAFYADLKGNRDRTRTWSRDILKESGGS